MLRTLKIGACWHGNNSPIKMSSKVREREQQQSGCCCGVGESFSRMVTARMIVLVLLFLSVLLLWWLMFRACGRRIEADESHESESERERERIQLCVWWYADSAAVKRSGQ